MLRKRILAKSLAPCLLLFAACNLDSITIDPGTPSVAGNYAFVSDLNETANRQYRGSLVLAQPTGNEDVTGSYSLTLYNTSTNTALGNGSGTITASVTEDGGFIAQLNNSGIRLSGRVRGMVISGTLILVVPGTLGNDVFTGTFNATR